MPDRFPAIVNDPDSTERGISQENSKRGSDSLRPIRYFVKFVVTLYKIEQCLEIGNIGCVSRKTFRVTRLSSVFLLRSSKA